MSILKLIPIEMDEDKNLIFQEHIDCVEILSGYPAYYDKVGYEKPWIGYFVLRNKNEFVGACGFKGKPKKDTVEIAYHTFKKFEGSGIGTEICRQLIQVSLNADPAVRITARTLKETNASTQILKKNGFLLAGTVYDEEDGDVWEWELRQPTPDL